MENTPTVCADDLLSILGIFKNDLKSRSVNNSFKQSDLGLRWVSPRVSRQDKTNPPPGTDFSISLSGFNYDMQSIPPPLVPWLSPVTLIWLLPISTARRSGCHRQMS